MTRNQPALHPFNKRFTWVDPPLAGRALDEEQAARFAEDGFLLYEGAFDTDMVNRIIDEIDPFEAEAEEYLRSQPGGRVFISRADAITFTKHLVKKSRLLRELSTAPQIVGLCHDLIGPDVRLYWDQAVYKKPGNPDEFPFHQDNGYTFIEPQQYLTCWVALTDTDEQNGCPWVVPGMHRLGTLAHRSTPLGWQCLTPTESAVPVRARAGDIVVFSSLTPHRTGPNHTAAARKSYILQYASDGACLHSPDDPNRIPQNDPDRQYLVLQGGEPRGPA